jgi:ubiquinone/menaquinone biosynthesis C-methylase UbiE
VLTVDFDRLGVRPGARLLDLGSGPGRHAFEAFRRGANPVCADLLHDDLCRAVATLTAMGDAGEAPRDAWFGAARADALALPFPDASFDHVIAS